MQPVPSAGKYATGVKRRKTGKTCNRCQARENVQLVQNAGKHVTSAKYTGCDRVPSPIKQGKLRTEENTKLILLVEAFLNPFSTVVVELPTVSRIRTRTK